MALPHPIGRLCKGLLSSAGTENIVRAINRKPCRINGDSGSSQIVVLDGRLTMAGIRSSQLVMEARI